ncbi:FecR family protein [Larkinella ripae]
MQQYLSYTVEQFVWDNLFRDWVLHPTPATDSAWQQWLAQNPEKTAVVQQARELVLALQVREPELTPAEWGASVRQIVARATGDEPAIRTRGSDWFGPYRWLAAAASVALLLGLGWWLRSAEEPVLGQKMAVHMPVKTGFTERRNTTQKPLLVTLGDGSVVVLQPKSSLRFPAVFEAKKREVHLVGDAFFEVHKDPQRPFLVLTDEIVTKVLGTSFSVRAFQNERGISVKVKTGQVAVFHRSGLAPDSDSQSGKVVLKARQQVEYSREKARMTKSTLVVPTATRSDPVFFRFEFDDTPLPVVLETLGNAYGSTIQYDKNQLKDCPLTARFSDQSLHEMLQFICTALNGSYTMQDGQLMLDVKGCND